MKKQFIPLLVVVSTALVTVGCEQKAADGTATSAPVVKKEDAVASVNGKYISKTTLENLEKQISQSGQAFPKDKIVEELIQRELLVEDAIQKKLDQSPEVLQHLDEAKKAILTQTVVQNFMKTSPVTDAEIKAEYDSKVGGANATEYKARHILVKTEDEAKKIIAELDKGADFAKLANKYSMDAKESQSGGELGWFVASQMVEPFSNAVIALEKGKYTKTPVKTQFGYHVILREDSRAQTPPPLEAVKEQLMPYLQRKKVETMIDGLRKKAKIEIFLPKEEPAKPAEAPKPAETAKPVAEEVVIEEEVKDKSGKTVAKETVVEEVVEEKAPAEAAKPAPAADKAEATAKKPEAKK